MKFWVFIFSFPWRFVLLTISSKEEKLFSLFVNRFVEKRRKTWKKKRPSSSLLLEKQNWLDRFFVLCLYLSYFCLFVSLFLLIDGLSEIEEKILYKLRQDFQIINKIKERFLFVDKTKVFSWTKREKSKPGQNLRSMYDSVIDRLNRREFCGP